MNALFRTLLIAATTAFLTAPSLAAPPVETTAEPPKEPTPIVVEPIAAPAPSPAFGYDKGIFVHTATEDGKGFGVRFNGMLYPRFTLVTADNSLGLDQSNFSLRFARIGFSGYMFNPDFTYRLLTDFASGTGRMADFYVNYAFSGSAQIRLGQWRLPFSRSFTGPATTVGLVDRSDMLGQFGVGRDLGLAFHNDYERGEGFQWLFGMFNGTGGGGTTVTQDPNTGAITVTNGSNVPAEFNPTFAMRLGYSQEGLPTFDSVDFAGGALRLGFGLAALIDFGAGGDEDGGFNIEADILLAINHFMLNAGVFLNGDDVTLDAIGIHSELSYLFSPKVGMLARYDRVLPDGDVIPDTDELTVGVTWFIIGHNLKWQTDVSLLGIHPDQGDGENAFRMRTQLATNF